MDTTTRQEHRPTRWHAEQPPYESARRVVDNDGNTIAAVIADPKHAELIAAAPELLEALRAAYAAAEESDHGTVTIGMRERMHAAIAKATGGAA